MRDGCGLWYNTQLLASNRRNYGIIRQKGIIVKFNVAMTVDEA